MVRRNDTLVIKNHYSWPFNKASLNWPGPLLCRSFSIVNKHYSSVQSFSSVRLFATPWIAARHTSLSIINSRSLLKTHVHWVSDTIQPSHPLSSPSPPAPNPSQRQGLFQWVHSSHEVARVLEFQLQYQSVQWTPRTDLLYRPTRSLVSWIPRSGTTGTEAPSFRGLSTSYMWTFPVRAGTLTLHRSRVSKMRDRDCVREVLNQK